MTKEITFALSELAGDVDVAISAADTPKAIKSKIVDKFESLKPLALSENEFRLTRTNRETQIKILGDRGVTPAIQNKLIQKFCSDELSLSESPDSFEFALSLAEDILNMRLLELSEKTKAQMIKKEDSKPREWKDITANMQPI